MDMVKQKFGLLVISISSAVSHMQAHSLAHSGPGFDPREAESVLIQHRDEFWVACDL